MYNRNRNRLAALAMAMAGVLSVGAPALEATAAEPAVGAFDFGVRSTSGATLLGACFDVFLNAGGGVLGDNVGSNICDVDGQLQFSRPPGSYVLVERSAPTQAVENNLPVNHLYARLAPRVVTINANETSSGLLIHARAGKLRLQGRRRTGATTWEPVIGACYTIRATSFTPEPTASFVTEEVACDRPNLDGWADVVMVPSGVSITSFAPTGYDAPEPAASAAPAAETTAETEIYFTRAGETTIVQQDSLGRPLTGGCYSASSNGSHYLNLCDRDDVVDGAVRTIDLPVGNYQFEEYEAPLGYELAAPFTAASGKTVTVKHTKRPWLTVLLRDPAGTALTGACFAVPDPDNPEAFLDDACDGADGSIDARTVLKQLTPGSWLLRQDGALNGYFPIDATPFTFGTTDMSITVVARPRVANKPPVAGADTAATDEDTAVEGNVLGNDTDPEGKPLTAAVVTNPTKGNVALTADGAFRYIPNRDVNGTDTFSYRAIDDQGLTTTATVTLTVRPVNDAPIAAPDSVSTQGAVLIDVLNNDTDVDSTVLTPIVTTQGARGLATLSGSTIRYAPNAGFSGIDSFTYKASDGAADSAPVTVTVTVTAPPPPPPPPPPPVDDCTIIGTAGDDTLNGTPGRDVICGLGGNDTINGRGGDDVIRGGAGNDRLHGNAGNDTIDGDAGNDRINGDGGDDILNGGDGDDRVMGGSGDDVITGGAGNNRLVGGRGNDTIDGQAEVAARRISNPRPDPDDEDDDD